MVLCNNEYAHLLDLYVESNFFIINNSQFILKYDLALMVSKRKYGNANDNHSIIKKNIIINKYLIFTTSRVE